MNKVLLAAFLLLVSCSDPGPVNEAPISFNVPGLGDVTRFSVYSGKGGKHYLYRIDGREEVNITIPKQGKHGDQKTIVIDGGENK